MVKDYPKQIYAIQHNVTKRLYIGSSKNVSNRYQAHMWQLRRGAHPVEDLQEDFDKHGEDFSVFILDEIKSYSERSKEYDWMNKYNTTQRGIGYNYNDKVAISKGTNHFVLPLKEGLPDTSVFDGTRESIREKYLSDIKKELGNCELYLLDLILKIILKRKKETE